MADDELEQDRLEQEEWLAAQTPATRQSWSIAEHQAKFLEGANRKQLLELVEHMIAGSLEAAWLAGQYAATHDPEPRRRNGMETTEDVSGYEAERVIHSQQITSDRLVRARSRGPEAVLLEMVNPQSFEVKRWRIRRENWDALHRDARQS